MGDVERVERRSRRRDRRGRWEHRRLTTLAVGAAALAVAAAGLLVPAPQAEALGKIKCHDSVGSAAVDPIMAHGMPAGGSSHLHQFFGSTALLELPNPNEATYSDLVGRGTSCRNPDDTAAYWMPVLRYTGTDDVVPVQAFTAYYRPFTGMGSQIGRGQAYPPDTRLVASATTPTSSHGGWNCGQHSEERSDLEPAIPDCTGLAGTPGRTLTAHVSFPSCWDGTPPDHSPDDVGDTRDNPHYAYPARGACPPAFPHEIASLRVTVQFEYTGDGTDVELSSDPMMGSSDGRSLHADVWNTWDQEGFTSMLRSCLWPGGRPTLTQCG